LAAVASGHVPARLVKELLQRTVGQYADIPVSIAVFSTINTLFHKLSMASRNPLAKEMGELLKRADPSQALITDVVAGGAHPGTTAASVVQPHGALSTPRSPHPKRLNSSSGSRA
jgi:hypothetical protein